MHADEASENSFPRQAARASIIAPIVAIVLGYLTRGPADGDEMTARIMIGIKWLLILFGFVMAIVALARIRRLGMRTTGTAILGLVLNGACIFAVIHYFAPRDRAGAPERYTIPAGQWKPFSSSVGRFSIELPGDVQVKTLNPAAPDSSSSVEGHQASVVLPDGSAFGVNWLDPPALAPSASPAEVQAFLDDMIERRVRGKTVLDNHPIQRGLHPGREVRLQMPGRHGPVVTIERDYVIGHRVYQVLVEMGAEEVDRRSNEITRFFDSFSPILDEEPNSPPR